MKPKVIKTESDYEAVMERIEEIFDAKPDTPDGDELELLVLLVATYEEKAFPIDLPDPVTAIRFRMEQQGLKQKDLEPYLGNKSKVSEVLSGQRALSLTMIRKLVDGLGIPAEVLLREPGATLAWNEFAELAKSFPIAEMRKRGWFEGFTGTLLELREQVEDVMERFCRPLRGNLTMPALNRQRVRAGGKSDPGAMHAWRIRVMGLACRESLPAYKRGGVTKDFLGDVVTLSYLSDGPLLAKELLNKLGIHLVVERHLPRTHLDGAAMIMPDGSRLVGITTRHNRLDNFWFTLLHELAHISLHLDRNTDVEAIFDDLDQQSTDDWEREADTLARETLIPSKAWRDSGLADHHDEGRVRSVAEKLRVHPSIVAGRVRFETGDYRLMNSLVGRNAVRKLFESEGE